MANTWENDGNSDELLEQALEHLDALAKELSHIKPAISQFAGEQKWQIADVLSVQEANRSF